MKKTKLCKDKNIKNEKSCGCIIFNNDNKVLLIHMLGGHWSYPKGHVEKGETEKETALREVKEETNIDCKIIDGYRYISNYSPRENVRKEVVYFIAKPISKEIQIQAEEVSEATYFSIESAMKIITFDSDKDALLKAVMYLGI